MGLPLSPVCTSALWVSIAPGFVLEAFLAVPLAFRLGSEADTREVEPLVGAVFVVAGNHITVWNIVAKTISGLSDEVACLPWKLRGTVLVGSGCHWLAESSQQVLVLFIGHWLDQIFLIEVFFSIPLLESTGSALVLLSSGSDDLFFLIVFVLGKLHSMLILMPHLFFFQVWVVLFLADGIVRVAVLEHSVSAALFVPVRQIKSENLLLQGFALQVKRGLALLCKCYQH